jgi:hypothetical protein
LLPDDLRGLKEQIADVAINTDLDSLKEPGDSTNAKS